MNERVWQWLRGGLAIALIFVLSSCAHARLLNLPFSTAADSLNTPYAETEPYFASSRYLTFVSDRSGTPDIYLYDVQAGHLVDLPGLNAVDSIANHPRISSDGRYLVFTGNRQGKSDIYLYDRQMRVLKNLTQALKADVRYPTISADGQTIAFETNAQGKWDIVLTDRFGTLTALPDRATPQATPQVAKNGFNP